MRQHNLSIKATLLFALGFLLASSAGAVAGGITPVIVVSTGDAIYPSTSPEPSARYAYHQTYGEPGLGAPMPSVWIYLVAPKGPTPLSGSFNGGRSYDSGELIIPTPVQGTTVPIGLEKAQTSAMPAVLVVVLPNGMAQQGPRASVGIVLMEEPAAWAKPSGKADGLLQIVQPGPGRVPVR